jgi:hypothetical protein
MKRSTLKHSSLLISIIGAVIIAAALPLKAQAENITCKFTELGDQITGTCHIPDEVANLNVNFDGIKKGYEANTKPDRTVNVYLKRTSDGWIGNMQPRVSEDPTLFEVDTDSIGKPIIGKLPFGWFYSKSYSVQDKNVTMVFDADHQVAPTTEDFEIINMAIATLSDESVWDKQDDRQCLGNAKKWSLFCALIKGGKDITGQIHYRQPAMQAAREVINVVGAKRVSKHRLQNWNNHPETTLAEVHDLLYQARDVVKKRMKAAQ